jgi:hypothetical protein
MCFCVTFVVKNFTMVEMTEMKQLRSYPHFLRNGIAGSGNKGIVETKHGL